MLCAGIITPADIDLAIWPYSRVSSDDSRPCIIDLYRRKACAAICRSGDHKRLGAITVIVIPGYIDITVERAASSVCGHQVLIRAGIRHSNRRSPSTCADSLLRADKRGG